MFLKELMNITISVPTPCLFELNVYDPRFPTLIDEAYFDPEKVG